MRVPIPSRRNENSHPNAYCAHCITRQTTPAMSDGEWYEYDEHHDYDDDDLPDTEEVEEMKEKRKRYPACRK
jgi:hypothetical protein